MSELPVRPPTEPELVDRLLPMARRLARRYARRGVDLDDLEQVASLALVKAIRRFDPTRGDLEPYAAVTIRGELRRHFRDHAWTVRPTRRIQELRPQVLEAQEALANDLHDSGVRSVADRLGMSESEVAEVLNAGDLFNPASLDQDDHGGLQAAPDSSVSRLETWWSLRPACLRLRPRDRHLLYLRFVESRSQSEIGQIIGISQMQVSRDLARVLQTLRGELAPTRAAG